MSYYKTCPYCGARLAPGEVCDCIPSLYVGLNPENRAKIDAFIDELVMKQKNTAPSAANTESGKVEKSLESSDSASIVH